MLFKTLVVTVLLVIFCSKIQCLNIDFDPVDNSQKREVDRVEERQFFLGKNFTKPFNGTLFPVGAGALGALALLLSVGALVWSAVLTTLLSVFWKHYKKEKDDDYNAYFPTGYASNMNVGYGENSNGYDEHSEATGENEGASSYTSYRTLSRMFDWETASILELISAGEELWHTFDASNLDCHKRVICELTRDTHSLGSIGNFMRSMMGYIDYLRLMGLPEQMNSIIEEYSDAADRGRSMSKSCLEMFNTCKFSLKYFIDNHLNKIK